MNRVLFFLILLPILSCNKEKFTGNDIVEIYFLQSYNTVGFRCEVDAATALLESDPFIKNDDIINYNKTSHTFLVKEEAVERMKEKGGRKPFAITVNNQVIYYGFYMPSIMSSTCEHSITMKETSNTKILMSLGYPFDYKDNIEDKRNDSKLLAALKKQGKLR